MIRWFPLLLVMTHLLPTTGITASDFRKERIQTSAKLFGPILSSELEIQKKKSEEGYFLVYVLGNRGSKYKDLVEKSLSPKGGLKIGKQKTPVKIEALEYPLSEEQLDQDPAAIFLADNFCEEDIALIVEYGISKNIVTFSPFEGDVEKGVTAGMAVGARILPYLNATAIKKSSLTFNPMLLRIGKIYE